jgi:hypothetical protein
MASAKQTAQQTADLLNGLAQKTEDAVSRAAKKIPAGNAEWRSTKPDFEVLSLLARYHALKRTAADQVTYFDATGDRAALDSATRDLNNALQIWERLCRLADGLYPEQMAFGPADVGHWKDKLPYARHDLELLRERADVFDRFGRFDHGFDFGGPVKTPANPAEYEANNFILRNTVAPRFQAVDPETRYSESLGYGWISGGERTAVAIPLTPYQEVSAVAKNPGNLPRDVLYRDYIRGKGAQVFRVKAEDAEYKIYLLHPDRSASSLSLKSESGFLNITFPQGEWAVSGLVIKGPKSQSQLEPQRFPKVLPRPAISHEPPKTAAAGQALTVTLRISSVADVTRIRLHYRPVNQLARFKTIEQAAGQPSFTIPAEDVSPRWDLMYYFEILNREGSGWFQPDPHTTTPYYVVKIEH